MKKLIINNLWWITILLALCFLILHVFSIPFVKVDNTTIVLLIIIFLSPFISAIKKIKFGDFEAEIDPKEVRKLKENTEIQLANLPKIEQEPITFSAALDKIVALVDDDPVLALAKLRIEIEKNVSRLFLSINANLSNRKNYSIIKMVTDLARQKVISTEVFEILHEVISICNRAVHGEEIRKEDAKTIVETGLNVLKILYSEYPKTALKNESEKSIIGKSDVDKFRNSKYQLTTIVPLVDKPYKVIRILNQDELDDFFNDYSEFAEFIIDVRKI